MMQCVVACEQGRVVAVRPVSVRVRLLMLTRAVVECAGLAVVQICDLARLCVFACVHDRVEAVQGIILQPVELMPRLFELWIVIVRLCLPR